MIASIIAVALREELNRNLPRIGAFRDFLEPRSMWAFHEPNLRLVLEAMIAVPCEVGRMRSKVRVGWYT
jgi:hypothetical protein